MATKKKTKRKELKKSYKVWTIIEEQTEWSDGSETYKDLKNEIDGVKSVGWFDTLEEACEQTEEIMNTFTGDFRTRD